MYSEILDRLSILKKELSPLQKREALESVRQLQKVLWVLPKKMRVGIVDFIKEEQEHGAFYLSSRIYEQITDTVACVSKINSFDSKTVYISGQKTIYTPYSGIEKNEDKNFDFRFKIFKGIKSLLSLNEVEQQAHLDKIIHAPVVYQMRNFVMHPVLKASHFIQAQRGKLQDYLLEKRILSSSKEYRETVQIEKLMQQAKSNKAQIELKESDIDLVLGETLQKPLNLPTPKKIVFRQNKITKNNHSRIHE